MQEEKNKHFIKNIEIKNFKCFEDFKAEGFGRVNLIGGKNNVGKTAFMEAVYLYKTADINDTYRKLLVLKTYRNMKDMLLSNNSNEQNLKDLILENKNINIRIERIKDIKPSEKHNSYGITSNDYINILELKHNYDGIIVYLDKRIMFERRYSMGPNPSQYEYNLSELINKLNLNLANTKFMTDKEFITSSLNDNKLLEEVIGDLKLNNKYKQLNKYLKELFNINNIDYIKGNPMIQVGTEYQKLSTFGDGLKSVIFYIGSLLTLKNEYFYIDEIENGIHYSLLDELWEIILTISKQQNVQVFATTHSKECIESYARVAKKLEDEEITMTVLARNLKNELKALVYDDKMFYSELEQNHEVRGW